MSTPTQSPECLVHVVGPKEVRLLSRILSDTAGGTITQDGIHGDFPQRDTYVVVVCPDLFTSDSNPFRFGKFGQSVDAIIALQSLFVPGDGRDSVLRLLSNLKAEEVRNHSDDGVAQTVTMKKGVTFVQEGVVTSIIPLQPFRTFVEVLQPESPFLLRLRGGSDDEDEPELPQVALFEADGGKWRLEAVNTVAAYLRTALAAAQLTTLQVLA